MPSRRSGTRSHHGCQNCKTRHVKCDETYPTCKRCLRRNEVCTLSLRAEMMPHGDSPLPPPALDVGQAIQHLSLPHHEHSTTVPSPASLPTNSEVRHIDDAWLDDMLLDHWVKSACWTLSEKPAITAVYHDHVPELATRYDHLKHALLSISGAHCVATLCDTPSSTIPPQIVHALVERSLSHQSLALNTFVKAITVAKTTMLNHEDCTAMTLASIFVLTSFIAHLHPAFQKDTYADVGPLSKAVALLNLQGPISLFFVHYEEQIAASVLTAFLSGSVQYGPEDLPHSEEAAQSLQKIALLCSSPDLGSTEQEHYAAVVAGLETMSKSIAATTVLIGGRFSWVIGETATYMANKIYQKSPEALVLLAHWAACQIPNPGHWWGTGFCEALITDIGQTLPSTYAPYIEYPLRQLEIARCGCHV